MRKNKSKVFALILTYLGILCIAFFFVYNIVLNKPIYKVTFDTVGGSIVATVEVEEGKNVERPNDPIKEGYNFIRWDYNNIPYDFSTEVKSDMTLTAIWEQVIVEPQKYTVTFKLEDDIKTVEVSDFSEINIDALGFLPRK